MTAKIQIGFVVLHFQIINETRLCINSIIRNVENCIIVIVDNCSPNNSGRIIDFEYKNHPNVKVICLKNNVGFANGNNAGYSFLKNNYHCDFICCINNDTVICQNDFSNRVYEAYVGSEFAVMAPLAIKPDNSIQSFAPHLKKINEYIDELNLWEKSSSYQEYLRNVDRNTRFLLKMPEIAGKLRLFKQKIHCKYKYSMYDVVLHGCFLIFSPKYIAHFDDAFDSRTFMYVEEELLFLRLRQCGLHSYYNVNIKIKHNENASTNATYNNSEEKYLFRRENEIKSLKILIEEMKKEDES